MHALRDRRHILFVDDEPSMWRRVERALHGAGLSLTCVSDGAQALRLLERGRIDLMVTPMAMPVIDGVDLLRHVANRGLAIPVIVATEREPPAPAPRSPLRFVREPLQPTTLADLVRERLADPGPERALGPADLAQVLALERRSCTLRAHSEGVQGELLFDGGVVVDAAVGAVRGEAAARTLLAWRRALLRIDPLVRVHRPSIAVGLHALLPAPSAEPDPPAHRPAASPRIAALAAASPRPAAPAAAASPRPAALAAASPRPATLAADLPAATPSTSGAPPGTIVAHMSAPETVPPARADSSASTLPVWEHPASQPAIATLIAEAMAIEGAVGVGLAVWELDHCVALRTDTTLSDAHMRATLSGHCRMIRATMQTLLRLGQSSELVDMLVLLEDRMHVLWPLPQGDGLFLDLVLDRDRGTLAFARAKLKALVARVPILPA